MGGTKKTVSVLMLLGSEDSQFCRELVTFNSSPMPGAAPGRGPVMFCWVDLRSSHNPHIRLFL